MKVLRLLQYIGAALIYINLAVLFLFYCMWWFFIGEEPVTDTEEFYSYIGVTAIFVGIFFLYSVSIWKTHLYEGETG